MGYALFNFFGGISNEKNYQFVSDRCSVLTKIVIPDSVVTIGESAFNQCENLSNVTLSKNLTSLGVWAFADCVSLKEIEIPKSLTTAGYYSSKQYRGGSFGGSGLIDISFEEGTTEIVGNLFGGCVYLEKITVPSSVVNIQPYAFYQCTKLSDVTIPDSVTVISDHVFFECSALDEIAIPDSVTEIGENAFYSCISLKEISIPNSVTLMGENIFYNCISLEKVKLPHSRQNINECMFYNCSALKEIDLPETVTNINNYAFYGCKSLTKIDLPNALTNIGSSAFYECKALSEITIPENVTSIGSSVFQNCDALTKVEIKGYGSIGSKAFYDCDALTSIIISDKVTSLGSNMCYGCDKLSDIKFGKGITTIPDSAFRLCQSLETVTIPRFCTTIEANAFSENTKLTSAYIPASVTSMQSNSFSYPAKMTMYGKPGSYAEEYANSRSMAFVAVDAPITTLAYPESSMNIGYRATVTPDMQIMPEFDTDTITFTSGDANIATVSANGAVYGKSYGTTTITMTTESGLSDSIEVTVVRPATSITLNKEGLEHAAGNSEVLTATISPTNSTDVIKWSSDNTAVAVVDDSGKITAVSKGTANITATAIYGKKFDTCLVTVVESNVPIVNVTGITLNSNEQEITIGKTYTLKVNVLPADATNKLVEWTTSNSSVADVANGVVTAKSLGEATITAKTVSGGFAATCKITVVPKVEITCFTAANYGANAFINLSVVNAPADVVVYVASYDTLGKLLELQKLTLNNGTASAIFSTSSVHKYKAFIWKGDTIKPISEAKEYVFK